MPRTLMLLRHAKSSWADAGIGDHDRPLRDRGRRRAARQAAWMRERGLASDVVMCSTALRARQTLDIVLPVLGEPDIRFEPAVYGADALALLALAAGLGDSARAALIVGHHPGLQDCASLLALTATSDARDRMLRKFPTSALAVLSFGEASWASLGPGLGHLDSFHVPPDGEGA